MNDFHNLSLPIDGLMGMYHSNTSRGS